LKTRLPSVEVYMTEDQKRRVRVVVGHYPPGVSLSQYALRAIMAQVEADEERIRRGEKLEWVSA
jgi:hypothetical protein